MVVRSEIDDIFASIGSSSSSKKGKGKEASSSSIQPSSKKSKSEKKDVKVSIKDVNNKRKQPETVIDPSKAVEEAATKSAKKSTSSSSNKKRKSGGQDENKKLSAEDEDFRDSRGSNRRKTDDGFAIYSESELKLDQGGDTPLCPFDCTCCF